MLDGQFLELSTSETVGLGGALLYSINYSLCACDRLPSQSPYYYMSQLTAAAMVLISLSQNFNLAAAIIQVFFIAVSIVGIYRHMDREQRQRACARPPHAARDATEQSESIRL